MNPILNQLNINRLTPQIQPVKQLIGVLKNAQNPMAMLWQMAMQNPQMQQAYSQINNILQQYNGDAEKAFHELCKQNNVNENDILNMLK